MVDTGIRKQTFAKAFAESQPRNREEIDELVDHVNNAKNMMARKHGYSPMQHVFGCELRMPGIATTGAMLVDGDPQYHPGDATIKSQAMRLAARKAMVEMDDKEKVHRAMSHRNREKTSFHVGQLVYYWRVNKDTDKKRMWRGPARVIGFYDKSKVWVSHGNKVLRCAQLRELSPDQVAAIEFLPVEAVKRDGKYALRGAQTFVDITNKEFPTEQQRGEVRAIDGDREDGDAKRRRVDEEDRDQEMDDEEQRPSQGLGEGEVNEESTKEDSEEARSKMDEEEMSSRASERATGSTYGPLRRQVQRPESNPMGDRLPENTLTHALIKSINGSSGHGKREVAENTIGPSGGDSYHRRW